MLSKLFKYEIKAVGRIMLPLYGASLLSALVLGIMAFFNERTAGMDVPVATLAILFTLIHMAIVIMTCVLSVTRFYNNLLGTEGYLMFSLPAGTPALVGAKMLSAVFWSFMSVVAGLLSTVAFALSYGLPHLNEETIAALSDLFAEIMQRLRLEHIQGIGLAFLFLLTAILAAAGLLARIYAALAIGHQWSSHRILGSVLAFIGLEILENWIRIFLSRTGINTYSLFLLEELDGSTIGGMTTTLLVTLAVSAVVILLYGMITSVLLDRRLNLE